MDRDTEDSDRTPEIVAAVGNQTGGIPLARPGVVARLEDDAPDQQEVDRAASMRADPSSGSSFDEDEEDEDASIRTSRAVS